MILLMGQSLSRSGGSGSSWDDVAGHLDDRLDGQKLLDEPGPEAEDNCPSSTRRPPPSPGRSPLAAGLMHPGPVGDVTNERAVMVAYPQNGGALRVARPGTRRDERARRPRPAWRSPDGRVRRREVMGRIVRYAPQNCTCLAGRRAVSPRISRIRQASDRRPTHVRPSRTP